MHNKHILSFTLPVRTIRTAFHRAFIGREAAPFEAIVNIFFSPCNVSRLVGIFYPQNELTAVLMGKQIIVQNGANSTKV
jgi:hypothetical protein